VKEIDLKDFNCMELCQNRNTYTTSLVQLSVAKNILEPKIAHEYHHRISEKLLEELSARNAETRNAETPKFKGSLN
jgi:hypothetical protein